MDRHHATVMPLLTTDPTTVAGAAALLNYMMCRSFGSLDADDDESILEDACRYTDERGAAAKSFLPRFAESLRRIAQQRGQA